MEENTHPPTDPGRCHYIKPDGIPCNANARHSSLFCYFHDPDVAEERAAAQARGGKERSRQAGLASDIPETKLETASDVHALLAATINEVHRGQLDVRRANAIGYLAGILLKAEEKDALEKRIAHLESVLKQQEARDPGYLYEFVAPEPEQ